MISPEIKSKILEKVMRNKRLEKGILILLLSVNVLTVLGGQNNSVFVDSILSLVIADQIPIYDIDQNRISVDEVEIIRCDTVVCDIWTRPKYINNIYKNAFDGAVIHSKVLFDTVTSLTNPQFLEFVVRDHDDNGNFLRDRTAFMTNVGDSLNSLKKTIDIRLITGNEECWMNEGILLNDEQVALDSCHKLYSLKLFEDFSFEQFYDPSDAKCFEVEMRNNITLGLEISGEERIEEFKFYQDKIQGHYLTDKAGRWKVKENQLILWYSSIGAVRYEIVEITSDNLVLRIQDYRYQVRFKKIRND